MSETFFNRRRQLPQIPKANLQTNNSRKKILPENKIAKPKKLSKSPPADLVYRSSEKKADRALMLNFKPSPRKENKKSSIELAMN